MGAYPISSRVVIDGVEAFDEGVDLAAGKPTLLDGLSFPWGRQTNVDQPEIGSCTFTIREQLLAGDGTSAPTPMLDIIHAGSSVEVWAKADIPASDSEVMGATTFTGAGSLDPSVWTHAVGVADSTVEVATRLGKLAAWVADAAQSGTWSSGIVFAPRPFAPEGLSPTAWDLVPRLSPGQSWTVEITATIPQGAAGHLIAYAYTDPHKSSTATACTVVDDAGQPVAIPADGAWHTLTATVSLPTGFTADGGWILPGVLLDTMPSQLAVADIVGNVDDQTLTFADYSRAGISEVSLTQVGPSARDVLVWAGEVTSAVGHAAGPYAIEIDVTASDAGAPLANETISDAAWLAQPLSTRVARILQVATTDTAPITIDPSLTDYVLSYRDDVQSQAVLGLLQDIAQSVGGVLWVATHATSGTFLWLEDPADRAAVRQFLIDATTGEVTIGGSTRETTTISASDVLAEPVQWTQDVAQVITSVDVSWLEQGTDGGGPTATEQTITVTDDGAKATYGLRKMQVSTELSVEADASDLADRLIAQARGGGWIASGLSIDTRLIQRDLDNLDYTQRLTTIMDLLDGTSRLGHGVTVIDLPAWTPSGTEASVYVEGGTYTLSRGTWQLQLLVSPATSGGLSQSATFADFGDTTVAVADFDPLLHIQDAFGVAGPVSVLVGFGGGLFGSTAFGL